MAEKLLNEKNIKNYLLEHPKFFKNNKDLLVNLKFTHENIGSSTSLLEKQNIVLRERLNLEKTKVQNLISTASENKKKHDKLVNWFSKLFYLRKNGRVRYLLNSIVKCFNLDAVSLIIFEENLLTKFKLSQKVKYKSKEIKTKTKLLSSPLVTNEVPECSFWSKSLDEGEVVGNVKHVKSFKSVGVVPIELPEKNFLCGVVILVSREKEKFTPDLDTLFLSKMGVVISAFVFNKEIVVENARKI